ncbi:hypothetical protein F9K07_07565 [Hydrogenophaga sp. BPS33]|nr:hypothetical protein F9K07_07565 [Hydrogenophaga sp. BPS33]
MATLSTIAKLLLAALMAPWIAAGSLHAQENYPTKHIQFISPMTAGGPGDALSRAVATSLSARLHVPVIVQNVPGAGSAIGTGTLARSAPDGYTLGLSTAGTFSINPFLYSKLPYNEEKDFAPISPLVS